jgi:hypothetical protein
MTEIDLKADLTIRYDEIKKVEDGYGNKGLHGTRISKKKRTIGRIVIIGVAAMVTTVLVLFLTGLKRDRDPQVISPR